jgi:flagellar protein FlaF
MFQFSYNEVVEDSPATMRDQERHAVDRIVGMLRAADGKPATSPQMIEALYFLRRLWSIWISDLGSAENELPEATRAGLLSIGIWMNKEIDLIQSGNKTDLAALIDINEMICDGLK